MFDINYYINQKKKAHLIGIGGVSMCSLAEFLIKFGIPITGSDFSENPNVVALRNNGVHVFKGHFAQNVEGADYIIRTAAIHDDNPEIVRARELGLPIFERAEAFGALMNGCKNAVCFAGTHGKTSSTSLFTHIALAAQTDPSVMLGGELPALQNKGYRVGENQLFVLEACEYHNSFLSFLPTVSVVLNVDEDHLDFFKDLDDIKRSFKKFAELVPQETGTVVVNGEDENAVDTVADVDRKKVTFGIQGDFDICAENLTYNDCKPCFDIKAFGKTIIENVQLKVPGRHNCMNSLAATAAALAVGILPKDIKTGLENYGGVGRRFEYKGTFNGAQVFDDYAHHPNELKALFDSALELNYNRVIAVFQPHTFTRTKAFWNDFVRELSRPDKLILADVYAARETDNLGISSSLLAQQIPNAEHYSKYSDIVDRLRQLACEGDIVITVGAGEMNQISAELVKGEK